MAVATERYFENLKYDTRRAIVTTNQTDTLSNNGCVYKVSDDEFGRPTDIEYRRRVVLAFDIVFGAARVEIRYTDTSETRHFFGVDNQPLKNTEGVFTEEYYLDTALGWVLLYNLNRFVDLIENVKGVANFFWIEDDSGYIVREIHRDRQLHHCKGEIPPLTDFDYDSSRRVIRQSTRSAVQSLANRPEGYAVIDFGYDERGNRIEERYRDADSLPCADYTGIYRRRYEYDDRGRITMTSQYDRNARPVTDSNGVVRYEYIRSECGEIIALRHLDERNNLIIDKYQGAAVIEYTYDNLGRPLKTRYFDVNNSPCMN
ncbi:MAG: hypothetical protein JXA92_12240 [candidate division Zixibacteria bacterium]|nr:hypothetical protein [candidate division Zixibacteria bacterium]